MTLDVRRRDHAIPQNGMPRLPRRKLVASGVALATNVALSSSARASVVPSPATYQSFRPGEIWLDTAGKPIQAHGGSIIVVDGKHYWYSENKEFTTGKTDVWTWDVRCYESTDLYNWRDLALIIPPNVKDRDSPLHPAALLDRPHILFNGKTRKFVCWQKLMSKGAGQTRTVLTADKITGPYTIVRQEGYERWRLRSGGECD